MKTIHSLKTWPQHFEAIRMGSKRAELRRNDRNFQAGDGLLLREWEPITSSYTGRQLPVTVTHVLTGGSFGMAEGHVLLSIRLAIQPEAPAAAPALFDECDTFRHRPDMTREQPPF